MTADERGLPIHEIAAHIGGKQETVHAWIANKGLPAHKVGRLGKFDRDEVDEWVRSGEGAVGGRRKARKRPNL